MNDRYHPPRHRAPPPPRTEIAIHEVCDLLDQIAQHRDTLASANAVLKDWLNGSADFSQAWQEFSAAGGISGADFAAFIGGHFRRRLGVRQHQHLRLIANREANIRIRRRPISRRRDNDHDPEAA
jgi:hypothetical protein